MTVQDQARDKARRCQHRRIDNDTWQCVECHWPMQSQTCETETVLSAPNLAACTNPECSGDIEDPNCWNPGGMYVPDRSREREIPIGMQVTYECDRCEYNGTFFSRDITIWDCGQIHCGDFVPVHSEARP